MRVLSSMASCIVLLNLKTLFNLPNQWCSWSKQVAAMQMLLQQCVWRWQATAHCLQMIVYIWYTTVFFLVKQQMAPSFPIILPGCTNSKASCCNPKHEAFFCFCLTWLQKSTPSKQHVLTTHNTTHPTIAFIHDSHTHIHPAKGVFVSAGLLFALLFLFKTCPGSYYSVVYFAIIIAKNAIIAAPSRPTMVWFVCSASAGLLFGSSFLFKTCHFDHY